MGHKRISSMGLLIKHSRIVPGFQAAVLLLYSTPVKHCSLMSDFCNFSVINNLYIFINYRWNYVQNAPEARRSKQDYSIQQSELHNIRHRFHCLLIFSHEIKLTNTTSIVSPKITFFSHLTVQLMYSSSLQHILRKLSVNEQMWLIHGTASVNLCCVCIEKNRPYEVTSIKILASLTQM